MDTKFFLFGLIAAASYLSASALKCYTCKSQKPNVTCFDPVDKEEVPVVECEVGWVVLPSETRAMSDQSIYARAVEKCASYEYLESNSDKEVSERSCRFQIDEADVCTVIKTNLMASSANLTKCEACGTDGCNGLNSSNILKTTFNLSTIFLIASSYFIV